MHQHYITKTLPGFNHSKWESGQGAWDPKSLVFLDETGLNIKMCRLYGRALKGKRCLSAVPHAHWHPATFIAALRHDRFTASFSTPSNPYGFWKRFPFLFGPPSSPLLPSKTL